MISSALAKSSLLHFLVVGLLFLSVDISPIPEPVQAVSVPVIEAVVIDQTALEQQLEARKQKVLAEKREKDRRLKEAQDKKRKEQERLANIEKQKKAEQARLAREKREAEKKKAEKIAAEKKRKDLEKKKAEEAAKRKKEEQAKREREAQEKAAEEARIRKEQAQQQREIEEQLLAEQQARARQRTEQVLSEVQKYTALITQAIQQKWIVDDSMLGKSCRLNIRLASNGLVIQVAKLGGDDKVCHSAETAIYKAYTLPVSSDPEVFKELKDFNLTIGHKI